MYYLVYAIFYLLSLLPWWFMYLISDGIYFLVYYVFGYRKEVVFKNLAIAFPNKTKQQQQRIAKDFYHQFVDSFIETIKLFSMSHKEFDKRCKVEKELVEKIIATGQNIQFHSGHFFNWEFVNLGAGKNFKINFIGVYMPLSNKVFEKLMFKLRSRYNTILVPVPEFRNSFHKYTKQQYALALAADQKPSNPHKAMWLPFFGKLTPFYAGPEKGAVTMNTAIIMVNFYKVKRGYYKIDFDLLTTTPKQMPNGLITKNLIEYIEEAINKRPANYLWTHKRWKIEFNETEFGHLVVE